MELWRGKVSRMSDRDHARFIGLLLFCLVSPMWWKCDSRRRMIITECITQPGANRSKLSVKNVRFLSKARFLKFVSIKINLR